MRLSQCFYVFFCWFHLNHISRLFLCSIEVIPYDYYWHLPKWIFNFIHFIDNSFQFLTFTIHSYSLVTIPPYFLHSGIAPHLQKLKDKNIYKKTFFLKIFIGNSFFYVIFSESLHLPKHSKSRVADSWIKLVDLKYATNLK